MNQEPDTERTGETVEVQLQAALFDRLFEKIREDLRREGATAEAIEDADPFGLLEYFLSESVRQLIEDADRRNAWCDEAMNMDWRELIERTPQEGLSDQEKDDCMIIAASTYVTEPECVRVRKIVDAASMARIAESAK